MKQKCEIYIHIKVGMGYDQILSIQLFNDNAVYNSFTLFSNSTVFNVLKWL